MKPGDVWIAGANEISEKTVNGLVKFLGYLWGPIPWMIEAAAVLSLIVHHWVDFSIIVVLLLFNAVIGFWQEYQAGNAVAALKRKLALKSRVKRDGAWQVIDARDLVPGDIVRLRLGDIIPADAKLIGTLLAAYGFGLITPIGWREIALIWGYSIVWAFLTDWAKMTVDRHFNLRGKRHTRFLETVRHPVASHMAHHGGAHS